MSLGTLSYEIIGDSYEKLYKYIMDENIPCKSITEIKGVLYLEISVWCKSIIEEEFDKLSYEYKITKQKGLFFILKKIISRKGLVFGGLTVLIISFIASNLMLNLEILCEDENIKKDITAVLHENGVTAGCFIPSINCTVIERELKQKVDGISWAGITCDGSTLIIDVVENVDKPEARKIRMPCNLVAKYDAVIDKIEVYDGQLVTTVGSGVRKGDILVSGTVITEKIFYEDGKEIKEVSQKYARSLGKIYGTFSLTQTFYQPFEVIEEVIDDKAINKNYLKIFDAAIPLFISKEEGRYSESSSSNMFSIFGFELPVGITHTELYEITLQNAAYTEEEALKLADKQAKKYENNFLKEYEIKDVKRSEKSTENGVEVTVEYTLYGDISQEVEFFINK